MSQTREVRWERMFPDELEAAFAANPVVYFAYGMCEPHGPQNAVGLDTLKAHAICCATAREYGGIVAPPDYWHIHELGRYGSWLTRAVGNVERGWMTSMPPWQHFKNICYHLRTADALGFHGALLLTGHYGPNWEDLKVLLELMQPFVGTRLYGLPDFEANTRGFEGDGRNSGDHAGRVETSLLWAVEPECVDVSRLPAHSDESGKPWFAMGRDSRESDRKTGEAMVRSEVAYLGRKVKELLADYEAERPEHRLLSFEDVEEAWRKVVMPVLPNFKSMCRDVDSELEPVPENSVWHRNVKVTPPR